MSELSLSILPETEGDAEAIARLHERTFGPGRYARSAYRIREGRGHVLALSFTARIGTLLVGSVRLTPICIGETPALLLGPLTVEPPFREHGVGSALIDRALAEAKGQGHRLVVLVGDEPFYVVLPDDLIDDGDRGVLTQMRQVYERHGSSLVGVQQVPHDQTSRYGIIDSEAAGERLHRMNAIVEKPDPKEAPSDLGVVGRYLLTPRIFDLLRKTGKGAGGEIQLTDAIADLLKYEDVYGYRFEGVRYDCGDKLGYLMATVNYGLAHPELGSAFRNFLHTF